MFFGFGGVVWSGWMLFEHKRCLNICKCERMIVMIIDTILSACDNRYKKRGIQRCSDCSYEGYCPSSCEKCLGFIHTPTSAPEGAPERKYDCSHMADFYTCKYSCRYTSEIIYALQRFKDLANLPILKVLSFGCGPCTDLFAIDYLHTKNILNFERFEYRGVDYSENVWKNIHGDLEQFKTDDFNIKFFYKNACELIETIAKGSWTPNLVVFQYVFSDMHKHTGSQKTKAFIETFAQYYNEKIPEKSYIILNDINLGTGYGGGRDYFDILLGKLEKTKARKGRFCDDNAKSFYYPRGYTYGEDSDGEFPDNSNFFDTSPWADYSPFETCASAQMLIKKEEED
jgi:hypothetical protein